MTYQAITPYADKTYGDAYFGERLGTDDWDGASDADKAKALKMATRMIDQLPLVGQKCDTETPQAREFPRDVDPGCADESGDVPDEVSQACCEVAIALLQGNLPEELDASVGVTSESVGDASVSYGGQRGAAALVDEYFGLPSRTAAQMLAPWLADTDVIDLTRV